jgi:RNA polymerase sigma factor (sigma-70 family)
MDENEWLAERFEKHRAHLRAVAYRMLGSLTDADDAVQDAWLRLNRAWADEVENLGGWLTTVVAQVCLNMLRSRNTRREESLDVQLASRARRRVKGADIPAPDPDLARQRDVVNAFFSAARGGDFDALVAVLDPDVVLRIDVGVKRPAASMVIHGAAAVARQAHSGLRPILARPVVHLRPALVNGAAGVLITLNGQPMTVMGFTVAAGKIDAIADPDRVRRIATAVLTDE